MHRLKALYRLAKDILDNVSPIQFNDKNFLNEDTNQISFTLKNYERPLGVAT